MAGQKFSTFRLLDLSRDEREIFLYLSRYEPCDSESIAESLGHDIADIKDILTSLEQAGYVYQGDDGYQVVLGPVTRRTSLPAYLWSAFLTTDRLYSEQEISALRTAVPMLQFGRARLSHMTDHGPGHAFRVKMLATQLGYILGFTSEEHSLLREGALFHDIGNVVDRATHNIISQETVIKLSAAGKLPFNPKEAELVGLLCRWHRKEYDPDRSDILRGKTIRTGLLASALRIADALDIDYRRSDYGKKFREVLALFFPAELTHWNSADEIFGVRMLCTPDVNLQVFTRGMVSGNLQIEMLRGDLASTPLDFHIREIQVKNDEEGEHSHISEFDQGNLSKHNALIVFPFEPHSIIMAGLSLRNLSVSGNTADILCYPDLPDESRLLWKQTLPNLDTREYSRLIVIGHRPDPSISPLIMKTIRDLHARNLAITILNRHEANWHRVPEFLQLGVEVVLGGDWAYFWGNPLDESAFEWGRVASLCTRDPTQSTVEITDQEYAAAKGLIMQVYEAIDKADKEMPADWGALANPLLDLIAANDLAFFSRKADDFSGKYGRPLTPERIEGNAAIFEQHNGEYPAVNYWMLEATIEKYGRAPVRQMQFNLPYMISTWIHDEYLDLLAINHWRDDTAIPIRLLYPGDMGPKPQGNESTIRARIPLVKSAAVIQTLLDACNQSDL